MDKVLSKIMNEVAEKHGVPKDQVEMIYMNMFRFIKENLTSVDFDKIGTEEDLRKTKVNFNIPRVFKLYTTKGRIDYAREAIRKKAAKHGKGVDVDDNIEGTEGDTVVTDIA